MANFLYYTIPKGTNTLLCTCSTSICSNLCSIRRYTTIRWRFLEKHIENPITRISGWSQNRVRVWLDTPQPILIRNRKLPLLSQLITVYAFIVLEKHIKLNIGWTDLPFIDVP